MPTAHIRTILVQWLVKHHNFPYCDVSVVTTNSAVLYDLVKHLIPNITLQTFEQSITFGLQLAQSVMV